ncbi:uncharacterized protein TNCV_747131 [Trichonephila clavipes]|nr:uncharacterized protein TNCV_747131 [Trichonephila clavipes]
MAYFRCPVREYIPNPLRCFNCQRYGHSKNVCLGQSTCPRCGEVGHDSNDYSKKERCVNCKGEHPACSRACPTWRQEKEITTVKIKNKISNPQARRVVSSRTPVPGVSYANVAKKNNPSQLYPNLFRAFQRIGGKELTSTYTELSTIYKEILSIHN